MLKRFVVLFLICGLALPVAAQEMGRLTYGQTVGGTLTGNGGHRWAFYGQAGDVVTISMVSESFDTYLELHDPSLTTLTTDDDSGEYLNSLISNYRLPVTGVYGIVARSWGSDATGSYGLTLELIDRGLGGQVNPPKTGGTYQLDYGQEVWDTLTNETCRNWSFYGTAGDTAIISAESDDFDTYLYLYDGYGDVVAENDDGGSNLNALMTITLNSTGNYTVRVCSYGGHTVTGDYRLSLLYDGMAGNTSDVETRTNYLTAGTYDVWRFDAMTGETVTIGMYSTDFDTYLELYAPNGTLLTSDDDSGEELNALIDRYVLPTTGTYEIQLRAFGSGHGNYTATLSFASGFVGETIPPSESGDYSIRYGQIVSDYLDGTGGHRWAFYGNAGDTVTINLTSNDFDTYVELHDPSLTLLAQDDDSGEGLNSQLTYRLPYSGEYGIVVHGYSSRAIGSYTLQLTAR